MASSALPPAPSPTCAAFDAALLPGQSASACRAGKHRCNPRNSKPPRCSRPPRDKHARLQAQALTPSQRWTNLTTPCSSTASAALFSEQIGAHRALLTHDEQARQSQQTLFAQITAQTTETDLWQRLDSLIGSAKGDKFRKFAQGLTLDHLLHLANRHLARLHGRYLLRRKTTGELELDIVDGWQGDVARDTRTLSGGESFLVSLALALALSDLVSHKTVDRLALSRRRFWHA